MMKADGDYQWLLSHVPPADVPNIHAGRVRAMANVVASCCETGRLPHTIGLFGSWGSGKTTFLALLAQRLAEDASTRDRCRVIYFNAWKYAGFMEIVPSLIYKILNFGLPTTDDTGRKIARIMLSLGKDYAARVGEWVGEHFAVDPVAVFKDAHHAATTIREGGEPLPKKLIDSYYTQVDQAQDLLQELFRRSTHATVVLIDELDRCDPDEAFNVIKQLRVFFAMRDVPVLFVVCANPEPIGLAIKHRYGLDSPTSDYEARRILEKFVDSYVDMSEPLPLGPYVRSLWRAVGRDLVEDAWIIGVDERHADVDYRKDTVKNATAFDAMTTALPLYANLRLLRKSVEYVVSREFANKHLLWTAWHLEIATQVDMALRRDIATMARELMETARRTHFDLTRVRYTAHARGRSVRLRYDSDKGGTLFGIFRSAFWDAARQVLELQRAQAEPQAADKARILAHCLTDYRRIDFLILMSLLPGVTPARRPEDGERGPVGEVSPAMPPELFDQFGWLLSNY